MANEILDTQGMAPEAMTAAPAPVAPENGMTPEEMTSDLKQKLAGVESAHKAVKSKQIAGENQLEEMRGEMIRSLFSLMQKYGVNLEDPKSVQSFLAELEANDPDLYDMFDIAFNNLVGQPPAETSEAGLNGMTNLGAMPLDGTSPAGMPPTGAPAMAGQGDQPPTGGAQPPMSPDKFSGLTGAMQG